MSVREEGREGECKEIIVMVTVKVMNKTGIM